MHVRVCVHIRVCKFACYLQPAQEYLSLSGSGLSTSTHKLQCSLKFLSAEKEKRETEEGEREKAPVQKMQGDRERLNKADG